MRIIRTKDYDDMSRKAANIIAACKMIRDEYDGHVPDTMEDLTRLPGVGRKTAKRESVFGKTNTIL